MNEKNFREFAKRAIEAYSDKKMIADAMLLSEIIIYYEVELLAARKVVEAAKAARIFVARRSERAQATSKACLEAGVAGLELEKAHAREHEANSTAFGVANFLDEPLAEYDLRDKKDA